ncbi:hypothetical protein HMN09_00729900 [Mycena chlorophos]|uniref:F-box domain-containing protein n=1 Tax=Mycena chlorophos TaxID=658473 RepID=A0A8H6W5M1_MYCCL|nr:hypothetical protein HMN09_00729900 [Mycena chlorophos]
MMVTTASRRVTCGTGTVIAGRVLALPPIRDQTAEATATGGAFTRFNLVDFPPEVVSLVCHEISDRATLAFLCRTSRAFLSIAQHVLYHTVDLEELPESLIISFFVAVADRSHLAARVHSLTVQIPGRIMHRNFAEKFAAALRVCEKMKDLAILRRKNGFWKKDTDNTWIFDDCQFHLTTFINSYFEFGRKLLPFLENQPHLRVLAATGDPHGVIHPEVFDPPRVPNVVAVCGDIQFLPKERPLEKVETSLIGQRDIDLLPILRRFSATLTTLNLRFTLWCHPTEVIRLLSDLCPALRHLAVMELGSRGPIRTLASCLPETPTYLMAFTQLETFAFILVAGSNEQGDASSKAWMVVDACPTLRRVVVGDQHRSCMATRTVVGGTVILTEGKRVTLDDVSMFWE